MKNCKVKITRNFKDLTENVHRKLGTKTEEFMCTKERCEYLLNKGAVKVLEVIEEQPKQEVAKKEIEEKPKKKTTKKKTKIDNK